ncbi:MAG: hypothetical protein IPO27_16820 [Bacteroidetes bacterium]|nr:hypothetical protein [Bacteroidota bacterium]
MKYLILLISLATSLCYGQSGNNALKRNVIVLPYNPLYYMSDADRDVAEQSKDDIKKIRNDFNEISEQALYKALSVNFNPISLFQNSDKHNDLKAMMQMLSYEYSRPETDRNEEYKKPMQMLKDALTIKSEDEVQGFVNTDQTTQYMRAVLTKPEIAREIAKKYEAEYFVILTQFEIKTNYKTCIDIANKLYQRELIWHFTIYDRQGNFKTGNYAKALFPSTKSDAGVIIGNLFPFISSIVATHLQQHQ